MNQWRVLLRPWICDSDAETREASIGSSVLDFRETFYLLPSLASQGFYKIITETFFFELNVLIRKGM